MIRKIMAEQIDVKEGVKSILNRINVAVKKKPETIKTASPTLIAVSKTKSVDMIADAYSIGQRFFGENYVKELVEKGSHPTILANCSNIKWHFIGRLQKNKINKIIKIPGLYMIETIDSKELANAVNDGWGKIMTHLNKEPLKVLVQVNTSGETEKNGIKSTEVVELYGHIKNTCPNLSVEGLMTIGQFGYDYSQGIPNPDFTSLMQCHRTVCQTFNLNDCDVHVSMGMSDDFEQAIIAGSSIVRVGTSIFGYRPKKHETISTIETC